MCKDLCYDSLQAFTLELELHSKKLPMENVKPSPDNWTHFMCRYSMCISHTYIKNIYK